MLRKANHFSLPPVLSLNNIYNQCGFPHGPIPFLSILTQLEWELHIGGAVAEMSLKYDWFFFPVPEKQPLNCWPCSQPPAALSSPSSLLVLTSYYSKINPIYSFICLKYLYCFSITFQMEILAHKSIFTTQFLLGFYRKILNHILSLLGYHGHCYPVNLMQHFQGETINKTKKTGVLVGFVFKQAH